MNLLVNARFVKHTLAGAIAALGLGLASNASAVTFDLTYMGFNQNPAQSVTLALQSPSVNGTFGAGAFNFMASASGVANQSFLAYCIELTQSLVNFATDYTTTTTAGYGWSNARQNDIARLYNVGYQSSLTSAVASAGFQLALWEMVYDSASYSLAGGNFSASSGNAAVISQANAYLTAAVAANPANGLLTVWQSPTAQNYLQFQVSEPGSLALLAGLGLAGFAARRRTAQAPTAAAAGSA